MKKQTKKQINAKNREYNRNKYNKDKVIESRINYDLLRDNFYQGFVPGYGDVLCMTSKGLAGVLGISINTMYLWQRNKKFPKPKLSTYLKESFVTRRVNVFVKDQVDKIVKILDEHFSKYSNFSDCDEKIIKRLFKVVK